MEYSEATLDVLRLEGDPFADKVITEIEAAGEVDAVNLLIRHLVTNNQPVPEDLPPVLQQYLEVTGHPPAGVDYERINRAITFFETHGMPINLTLATAGLVQCFAVKKGVYALAATHRCDHPQRRVIETAQFCIYMMSKDSFTPHGKFIRCVQKVRLMHTAVRYLLLRSGTWPQEELGVPLCQEDMLGALLLFSVEVLRSLGRMGLTVTPTQAEDYYYIWQQTGLMLGIRPDIIPATLAEAEALMDIMEQRHFAPSAEGIALTKSLVEYYESLMHNVAFAGAIPALIRTLTGDEVATMMEIPHTRMEWVTAQIFRLGRWVDKEDQHSALMQHVVEKLSYELVMADFSILKGKSRLEFDIPHDLKASWQLDTAGKN
jgi:hypothetical protein